MSINDKKQPEVDAFLNRANTWQNEMATLRSILLASPLTETFKWRNPCYTSNNNNLVLIGSFKNHCALSFFKGSLLEDKKGLLDIPGKNSQAVRFFKFTSVSDINNAKDDIIEFINQSIKLEEKGIKVDFSQKNTLEYPPELIAVFKNNNNLKIAFEKLTPGRQRGYLLFFTAAKQSATVVKRIEKHHDRILSGKGINDCTCGLTKRSPNCDGSHKQLQ